jgi:hypothetical protein
MNADETAMRLQETAAKCLSSFDAWNKDLKDNKARESLLEAVHELRKVTSRLEIDIAMNDRKALNAKPLPVPEHKSKIEKRKKTPLNEIVDVEDLKEKGKKRKIEIEEANAADHDHDDSSEESDNQEQAQEKKQRRPRRKKREDSDN